MNARVLPKLQVMGSVYLTFTRSNLKEPRNSVGTWIGLGIMEHHKFKVGNQTISLPASMEKVILGWFMTWVYHINLKIGAHKGSTFNVTGL